jgi:hypothetical protein
MARVLAGGYLLGTGAHPPCAPPWEKEHAMAGEKVTITYCSG